MKEEDSSRPLRVFYDGEMLHSSPRPRSRSIESSDFSLLGCDSMHSVSKLQIVKLHLVYPYYMYSLLDDVEPILIYIIV